MKTFAWIYFAVLIIELIIRVPINQKRKQQNISEQRVTSQERILLGLLSLGGFLPIIYIATNWLDFVNYRLPAWAGWLGILLATGAVLVFWRGHADLGLNWSPSLEIREKHELITRGIYGVIRHPMYASQWLLVLGLPLLLQNWIAGFINLLVFIPFYFLRVRAEEQMMQEQFGDQYRTYMQAVGSILPKF